MPCYISSATGLFLVNLFFWNLSFMPLILSLLILSIPLFWYDLMREESHYECAFWLFILREVMVFGSLLFCCFWYESSNYSNLSSPIEIPFLGCFLLLGSSITVTGFHHVLMWDYSWVLLALTVFLGFCFVLLQIYEMKDILMKIVDTTFHASRLCTVGLHFRHVLLGVIGLRSILFIGAKSCGEYWCTVLTWYWHFVDYIWLLVYAFVYVCFTDRLFKLANCGFVDYLLKFMYQ